MTQGNIQYTVGTKRQVIGALRKVFQNPDFPDSQLATKINIELQYPIIQEKYPALYISYKDTTFVKDSGLGNYYYITNSENDIIRARQWFFEGDIFINILALDPVERDHIAAILAGMLAFSKDDPVLGLFRNYVTNEDFVSLQPNFSHLYGGDESYQPSPWGNKDEFIYIKSYFIHTLGCFFTEPGNATGDLITIDKIRTYPYRSDQLVPTGSTTQTELTPWEPFGTQ